MLTVLFNLPLANETIYCVYFYFFSLFLKDFLAIPWLIESNKARHALVISTSAPITVANEEIETPGM